MNAIDPQGAEEAQGVQPLAPVSIAAVAERAGVSIATVSRVMNGVTNKTSEATHGRVRDAIQALGYRPMGAGRSLRSRRSRLVAVLAANLANPTMAAIAAVTEVALRRAGFVMVLCDSHDQADLQDEYLLEMRAQYACGFVLLGAVASPALMSFRATGEPLVFVNRSDPFGSHCHVGIDNSTAGAEVAHWFDSLGRGPVALIHGRLSSSATAERVSGFLEAARALSLEVLPVAAAGLAQSGHLEIGYHAMLEHLAHLRRPRSVFCTSDLIAYGAHRAAREQGLDPQKDIVFVGFDDSPLNPWVAPWLNAVRVPYAAYGDAIVQALTGRTEPVRLTHELVIRTPPPFEGRESRTETLTSPQPGDLTLRT
jgi:LacI family transcriptional regulator